MILIVDDDKTLAKLATRMLEGDGYEVAVAHNGEDAYAKIQAGGIDCVLLDMHMPKVNGAELLMLLAADGDTTPGHSDTAEPPRPAYLPPRAADAETE